MRTHGPQVSRHPRMEPTPKTRSNIQILSNSEILLVENAMSTSCVLNNVAKKQRHALMKADDG